jgi:hypothetical protein
MKKQSADQDRQQIHMSSSLCLKLLKLSYKVASEYKKSNPCTNVPVYCPLCPECAPAVWKYNLEGHLCHIHPDASPEKYQSKWRVGKTKKAGMQIVWDRICKPRALKDAKKTREKLKISEGHSLCLALRFVSSLAYTHPNT